MHQKNVSLNPFPGLRAFRADEDYLFFGREEQTMDLLKRLASSRFVAVVGTSGSGKSSLVRCGLLSELLGGKMLDAGASWEVALTHPGGNPLGLLTEALLEAELYDRQEEHARENLLATLSRSHFGLIEAVKQSSLSEGANFLLVVDQFEEIFRFHEAGQVQQEAANEFISLLLEAVAQKDVPIYVVLTMRSDFIGECGQFEGLAEMVNRGEFLIPRLTREQYKRIIEGPIKVAGGQITPRLLQRLLNDIGQQQDQLPCLQHALMRTWNVWAAEGDSEALDLDDYQRVGRMAEALSLHADEVYNSLADDRQRELCRGMFQALTVQESENRGIRRPQRLASLCQILEVKRDEIAPIIDAYRQSGVTFLMPSAEVELTDQTIIDISHESLMRVWTRLRHWVEEEAQASGIYRRLSESAALYRQRKAGLYRDPELGIALAWRDAKRPNRAWAERYAPDFAEAMAFLDASREAAEEEERAREAARQHELEQAQQLAEAQQLRLEQQHRAARRMRVMISGLAVVALVAGAACVAALVANNKANALAELAKQSAAKAEQNAVQAEHAQRATAAALTDVEREKNNAELNLRKAEAAEAAARRAEDESRRLLYTTDMKLAPFVWKDDEATAEQLSSLLARHDPVNANDSTSTEKQDLRGFEWYYYRHLIEDAAGVFQGGNVAVVDCAVTSDGQLVGLDERVQIRRWDVETHAENEAGRVDLAKGRSVQTSALAPDGRTAALAIDNQVRLVDAASGDERFTIDSVNVGIRRIAFSGDGKWLVIFDDRLRWCDATSGKVSATMAHTFNRCEALALTSDGLTCLVAGHGNAGTQFSAFRLDAMTAKVSPLAKDKGFGGTVGAAAISPNGALVAIGHKLAGMVILYDAATGIIASYKTAAHASPIAKIAFSRDSSQLATSDMQGTIKLWSEPRKLDTKSTVTATLKGHSGAITKLMFLPDGKRLVSASADKTVRVWDTQQAGAAVHTLASSSATWGQYSPDGLFIASAGDRFLRLWDATSGQLVRQVSAGAGTASSVACSPDNRLVAVGYGGSKADSYVALLDMDSGRQLARLAGAVDIAEIQAWEDNGSVTALAFSPDGKYLVAGFGSLRYISDSRTAWPLKVWEVSSRRMVRRLEGCLGYCASIDISRDGSLVAAGGHGGTASVWSTANWTRSRTFENPEQDPAVGYRTVYDVRLSPDGHTLAMASAGGSILLWDIASGMRVATLKGHASAVVSVAFAPDGRTLASAGRDNTVRLWNVDTRRELLKLDSGAAEQLALRRLAFSPDSSRLFAGGYQRSAFWSSSPPIWDAPHRAAEILAPLVSSDADFEVRVRSLSDNLRLHDALERLNSDDRRVEAALAAARAHVHAARRRWPEAVEEFQRLKETSTSNPANWYRTLGLVRIARALVELDHYSDAAMLLADGAKRRIADGAEVGLGIEFAPANGEVNASGVVPGSPADKAGLHKGDVILKVNGLDAPADTVSWLTWQGVNQRPATKVHLTIRRTGSSQTEDVVLSSQAYFANSQEADALDELSVLITKRLAAEPANARLLELSALVAAHRSESESQIIAATAAIDAIVAQSSERAEGDLKRLYRLRGDGYVALKDWPKAADDYSRGITDESSADELSNWALAQAETTFGKTTRTIVPTSEVEGISWRYTTKQPSDNWADDQFDDSSWQEGSAPFGSPTLSARTGWTGPDIWLRHQFDGEPLGDMKAFFMWLWVDDTAEFFLNGERIANRDSWTSDYVFMGLDKVGDDRFRAGPNTLAVHCHNVQGPGFFDMGLFAARTDARDRRAFFDAKARREPWVMLALAYRMAGEQEAIDKLVERHPQAAGAIGDLFAGDEDWQRAVEIYSAGQAFQPDSPQAGKPNLLSELLAKLAIAKEHLDDWDAAAAGWERVAQDNPDAGRLLAEFARRLADNGQSVLAAKYYDESRRMLEDDLRADPGNVAVAETLGKLLLDSNQASDWMVLKPIEAKSELGATLSILSDNSILAGGANPLKDRYHVVLTAPAELVVTAVRLEALTHPSLPNHGPGRSEIGNFAQISWDVKASQPDGKTPVTLEFEDAWADHQNSGHPIATNGHWNIYGGHGGNCTAIWTLAKPLSLAAGATLAFDMQCQTGTDTGENLGHFRLSLSSDRAAIKRQKAFGTITSSDPRVRLAAGYALRGDMDQATRIAGRLLTEADTATAKARLLEAISQTENLLAAVAKTQTGDLEVNLALARQFAERGVGQAFLPDEGQADAREADGRQAGKPDLLVARDIFARLHKEYPEPRWTVLTPTNMTSQGGATLTELDDGSLLAGGPNPAKEVYEVETNLDAGAVTALRLEGLPHDTMPGGGMTRGYTQSVMLTELEAETSSADSEDGWQAVKFNQAWANDEVAAYPVANAIDGTGSTPWGSRGNETKEVREAVFVFEQPIEQAAGKRLRIRLRHEYGAYPQQFGRFRLAATSNERVLPAMVLRQSDRAYRDCLVALGKAEATENRSDESVRAFADAMELARSPSDKREIIANAMAFEGVLEKLAAGSSNDADLQAGLARYYASRGESALAAAARAKFIDLYERDMKADQPEKHRVEVAEALAAALVDSIRARPEAVDEKSQLAEITRITDPWMRLAAAYACGGEMPRAVNVLNAHDKEAIAASLDESVSLDAIIKLLAINPELDRLSDEIKQHPNVAAGYTQRGWYYARLGRWRESADDLLRIHQLSPENHIAWMAAAPSLILAGDEAGYQQLCREMITQFRGSEADTVADVVCKTCLIRPGMVDLAELPVKRLKDATDRPSVAAYKPYFLGCCALASYREGNAREAIAWADKLTDPASIPVATALVLTVRALAEHRLGRSDEARQTLARASDLIPAELRTLGSDDYRGPLPVALETISHDWLIPEILRREASALLEASGT